MSSGFKFTEENLKMYQQILKRYDDKESAILPTLHMAQEQNGYLGDEVLNYISELMDIPVIKFKEVVSFYDMFYDKPVGRNIVQVCTNISCSMFGGREIHKGLLDYFGAQNMKPVDNGRLYFQKMECLGACSDAPCMRVNNDYHGKLNLESAIKLVKELD